MSEQVTKTVQRLIKSGDVAAADMIDALHAEAEALRAENMELMDQHQLDQRTKAKLSRELEAARGLLEQCALSAETLRVDSMAHAKHAGFSDELVSALRKMTGVISGHGVGSSAYPSQREAINASPAPEVRQDCEWCAGAGHDHFGDKCAYCDTLAEQGERQEAVAEVVRREPYEDGTPNPCRTLAWALRNCEDDLPVGTKLYTTPQPSQDVRGLVEAAQAFADAARPNIYPCPDKPHSLSGKLQALDDQLAAHRQAQRKGESHDT